MLTKDDFANALHILRSIDQWETKDFMSDGQYLVFVADPYLYFLNCDAAIQEKLWAVIAPRLEAGRRVREKKK